MAQNYSNLNCQSPRPRLAGGFKAMDHSSRKPIVTTNQRNMCGASHTDPWIPSVHPFLGVRLVLVGDIDINRPRISPINSPTISPFWLFHPLCYHFWDALPAAFTAKLLLNIRVALCHCPASALHSALRATALQLPRGAWESSQSWRAFGHSSGEMAVAFEVETSWNIRDTVNGTLVRDGDPLGTPWRSMLEVPNNIYMSYRYFSMMFQYHGDNSQTWYFHSAIEFVEVKSAATKPTYSVSPNFGTRGRVFPCRLPRLSFLHSSQHGTEQHWHWQIDAAAGQKTEGPAPLSLCKS